MWVLERSPFLDGKLKRLNKNHPAETKAMLENLDKYLKALNEGANPINIQAGWIHHEPDGIKALDQKGTKGKPAQTRLYIFPAESSRQLHVITAGDKSSQRTDIQESRDYIKPLKERKHGKTV
ncbi:MAG: hypothetical protein A2293_05790 [Elusimicrobia bacterium RIFOXYB2_FULL_49_7]|nr:MAG: hypothetical protein A2293_05790 [Elusimicrobia bacterium RIFOXYB2_FULL_49_7]